MVPDHNEDIDESLHIDISESENANNISAHSTKINNIPPSPPPPRRPTKLNYTSLDNEFTNYSSNAMSTPTTNISVDDDVKKILTLSVNQYTQSAQLDDGDKSSIDDYNSFKVDFYTDIPKFIRKNSEPGVILPSNNDLFESYLAPILMILSTIPTFNNLILKHEFLNYGYKPNWWNREKCLENPSIVIEVQRLVAFLNGNSNRSFASLFNLIKSIAKLVKEDIESVLDFHIFFMEQLLSHFSSSEYSIKQPLENMFKMVVGMEDNSGEIREQPYYHIPISSENTSSDLYHAIYRSLFPDESNYSSRIYLTKAPDVLTIVFDQGMDNVHGGFSIDEFLYPQIYSWENKDILSNLHDELQSVKLRQREINQKMFQLKAFNGKNVRQFLTDAKTHLKGYADRNNQVSEHNFEHITSSSTDNTSKNGNNQNDLCLEKEKYEAASQSISILSDHITTAFEQYQDELKMLNERTFHLESSKYNIDQLLSTEQKESFEPWILIGVIFNPVQFYYRETKSEEWIGVNISAETCKSYALSKVSFEDVKRATKNYTEYEFGVGMLLIYVRKSILFNDDYSVLNHGLQAFIDKDNEKLKEQIDIFMQSNRSADTYFAEPNNNFDENSQNCNDISCSSSEGSELEDQFCND